MVSDLGGHLEEGLLLAPLWAGERSTFGFEVVGQGGHSRPDAPRSAEHHRTPRPVREGSLVQRNPTPGPYGLHLDGELSHGDRTEDLEGQSRRSRPPRSRRTPGRGPGARRAGRHAASRIPTGLPSAPSPGSAPRPAVRRNNRFQRSSILPPSLGHATVIAVLRATDCSLSVAPVSSSGGRLSAGISSIVGEEMVENSDSSNRLLGRSCRADVLQPYCNRARTEPNRAEKREPRKCRKSHK